MRVKNIDVSARRAVIDPQGGPPGDLRKTEEKIHNAFFMVAQGVTTKEVNGELVVEWVPWDPPVSVATPDEVLGLAIARRNAAPAAFKGLATALYRARGGTK